MGKSKKPPKLNTNPTDPEDTFIHALAFERARDILQAEIEKASNGKGATENLRNATGINLFMPKAAVEAFSVELYLKCLLTIATKSFPQTRDLSDLYAAVPPIYQTEIIKKYNDLLNVIGVQVGKSTLQTAAGTKVNVIDLAAVLDAQRNRFEEFRYLFEKPGPHDSYLLDIVARAVREAIVILKPGYAKHAVPYTSPQPYTPPTP